MLFIHRVNDSSFQCIATAWRRVAWKIHSLRMSYKGVTFLHWQLDQNHSLDKYQCVKGTNLGCIMNFWLKGLKKGSKPCNEPFQHPPPLGGQTQSCENITFPQLYNFGMCAARYLSAQFSSFLCRFGEKFGWIIGWGHLWVGVLFKETHFMLFKST